MEPKNTTHIFFDMEFTGLHQNTTPISLGMIADDGRGLYCEFDDYDQSQVDDWISDNVLSQLYGTNPVSREDARRGIERFIEPYESVIMVSDCLAYDWVLFCELWGGAMNIPKKICYIPIDISTLFYARGIDPDIDRESFAGFDDSGGKHKAHWDAHVIKLCFERLKGFEKLKGGK